MVEAEALVSHWGTATKAADKTLWTKGKPKASEGFLRPLHHNHPGHRGTTKTQTGTATTQTDRVWASMAGGWQKHHSKGQNFCPLLGHTKMQDAASGRFTKASPSSGVSKKRMAWVKQHRAAQRANPLSFLEKALKAAQTSLIVAKTKLKTLQAAPAKKRGAKK